MTDTTTVSPHQPIVIDCHYAGHSEVAAAFLVREGDRAAFIEANTSHAIPRLLKALEAEGMTPDQVEWVIITHVHLDHAGGAAALLEACPNATLLGHPRATPHVIDPSKLVESATAIYGADTFERLYGTIDPVPADRVRAVADGETLTFGERTLRFFFTRGHANHHMCIHDDKADAIYTGDNFGLVYPGLQDNDRRIALASTPPTDFDAQAALESIERILAVGAQRVYVTHYGGYSDLEPIAAQLRDQLQQFASWVEEAFHSDLDNDALQDHFSQRLTAMVEAHLTAGGIPAEDPRRQLLSFDRMLNAQGLAFAVKKRRYKARKAAEAARQEP